MLQAQHTNGIFTNGVLAYRRIYSEVDGMGGSGGAFASWFYLFCKTVHFYAKEMETTK